MDMTTNQEGFTEYPELNCIALGVPDVYSGVTQTESKTVIFESPRGKDQ